MLASSAHHSKFAPPVSSPGACAKGGRRSPLLASAATSLDNVQRQRLTGTALGRRLVMYRSTLGVAKVHGRGLFLAARGYDLPDYHLAGAIIGSGPFVNLRRQPRRQALADLLPSHFKVSVPVAPTHSDKRGQSFGYRGQEHERHDG